MQKQSDTYFLFVDDSGSSCPDRVEQPRKDGIDAFALGGFLIKEDDIDVVKELHKSFMISQGLECPEGKFKHPLHSTKIRCKKNQFTWLNDVERAQAFYEGLQELLSQLPVIAHACVIHRPTYRERYHGVYENKWQLSRSAYQILIERAVKYVRSIGGKRLLVYVEKTGRKEDRQIEEYHSNLLSNGMEFDKTRSASYQPIDNSALSGFLSKKVTFQTKNSRLMQFADLLLYPLIKGGYDPDYQPYRFLRDNGKLVDTLVEDVKTIGVKYYCFTEKQ